MSLEELRDAQEGVYAFLICEKCHRQEISIPAFIPTGVDPRILYAGCCQECDLRLAECRENFLWWLIRKNLGRPDGVGQLALAVANDANFPLNLQGAEEYRRYLAGRGFWTASFPYAWDEWLRYRADHTRRY